MENNESTKKTKHVHFISGTDLSRLETEVNRFADDHPDFKIFGIKLSIIGTDVYVATITYLCNAFGDHAFWEED